MTMHGVQYLDIFKIIYSQLQIKTRGPKGHCHSPEYLSTMNAREILDGTKNNNTSSHMLLDNCYTFDLLL